MALAYPPISSEPDRSPCLPISDELYTPEDIEAASRTEDFLNDKLQAHADLGSYDALLASVELQRQQLESQLQSVQVRRLKAQSERQHHTSLLVQQKADFAQKQKEIDRRLAIVTASDAPDEAVAALNSPVEKLRKLELAHLYVELLQELDDLSERARSFLPDSPKEALAPYARLREISKSVQSYAAPTEGAATHLVNYVDTKANELWRDMQSIMSRTFRQLLLKQNYPQSAIKVDDGFKASFYKMMDLQQPEFTATTGAVVLLPFTILTETFQDRFRYHFMGSRETNSKTDSELAFNWVVDLFSAQEDNLRDQITPLLLQYFTDHKYAHNSTYLDAPSAFITAFLPIVKEKCEQFLSRTHREPQHMSRFFQELLRFDERLRDEKRYDGGDMKHGWRGITYDILQKWFNTWQAAEKQFALARYEEIVSDSVNLQIDYDSGSMGQTKTTNAAEKIMDLFNSVTILYKPLRSFSYKLRFLIDVQLSILDRFHNLLKDSLNAYISMTSRIGRMTHGISKEDQAKLEGTGGIVSLCKVYGSADHVILELEEHSNSAFFVDLWNVLQNKAQGLEDDDNLAGPMTSEEVKGVTSSAVGSLDDGAVFDETSNAYKRLRLDAERLLIQDFKDNLPRWFKNYTSKPEWMIISPDEEADIQSLHITAELDEPLQALSERLGLLHRTLSTAALYRIWRSVARSLQDLLWYQIVMHQRFTSGGGRQFHRDQQALLTLVNTYVVGASETVLGMPKIQEAAMLLSLPTVTTSENMATIEAAYDRVMRDNASAKAFVEDMGLNELDFGDARKIIGRRVEVGE